MRKDLQDEGRRGRDELFPRRSRCKRGGGENRRHSTKEKRTSEEWRKGVGGRGVSESVEGRQGVQVHATCY